MRMKRMTKNPKRKSKRRLKRSLRKETRRAPHRNGRENRLKPALPTRRPNFEKFPDCSAINEVFINDYSVLKPLNTNTFILCTYSLQIKKKIKNGLVRARDPADR